jgi:hypothetical protein
MVVLVLTYLDRGVAHVVGPYDDFDAAERDRSEWALPMGWTWEAIGVHSRDAVLPVLSLGRGRPDAPAADATASPENSAHGAVEYVSTPTLVERIREQADGALSGLQRDDPSAVVEAIRALRLELRAATLEIVHAARDVVGALERVGLGE